MRFHLLSSTIALLAAFILPARANDSAFSGVGGTPKLLKGEHRAVAMQSEKIVITAGEKFYDTRVDFVFRNDGAATTVQMGFPEDSYGDVPSAQKSAFVRFQTWVDGQKVPAKRLIFQTGEGSTSAYWLKTVRFARRQTRRVRVEYRSPMGGNTSWGTYSALNYPFTGQNWKGNVERSDLEIRVTQPGLWVGLPLWKYKPMAMDSQIGPKSAVFRKTWRNWQAQGEFTFGLTRAVPFWMLDRARPETPPDWLKRAVTFRIGEKPTDLSLGNAVAPPAFVRDDVAFVSLKHLSDRLEVFAEDLKKSGASAPFIARKWDAKTGTATLYAGRKTFQFVPGRAHGGAAPILLSGHYAPVLYVPIAPIARTLGLQWKADLPNRLFDLKRGQWTGK